MSPFINPLTLRRRPSGSPKNNVSLKTQSSNIVSFCPHASALSLSRLALCVRIPTVPCPKHPDKRAHLNDSLHSTVLPALDVPVQETWEFTILTLPCAMPEMRLSPILTGTPAGLLQLAALSNREQQPVCMFPLRC